MKKLKKPSRKELSDLFYKVDSEGFYYYMTSYGPDMELIQRCGFDAERIYEALGALSELEDFINEIEPLEEE